MDVVITQKAFGRISGKKLIKFEPDSKCPSFTNTLYNGTILKTDQKQTRAYKYKHLSLLWLMLYAQLKIKNPVAISVIDVLTEDAPREQ